MRWIATLTCLVWALAANSGHAQQSPDINAAAALIQQGKGAEVYRTLLPFEAQHAGDAEFDYLLGIAALDAGQADKATLALERVVILKPAYLAARLDLARAYFALGDLDRARTEFEAVQRESPPPAAQATIERYLAAIAERRQTQGTRATGYLDAAMGRDTNVNAATAQGQVFVPLFGVTFGLASVSQQTRDYYLTFGGGGEINHGLNERWSVFAGGDVRYRVNRKADTYDYTSYDARGGVQYGNERDVVRAGLAYQHYDLDNAYYRETKTFNLEWRRTLNERNQFTLFGQYSVLRYPNPRLTPNDVNQTLAGGGWTHVLDAASRATVSLGGYAGYEREVGGRVDGDRKLYGVRVSGQMGIGAQIDLYASAAAQRGDYREENPLFLTLRAERQYDVAAGLAWRFAKDWSLRPQLTYTRNKANITLYDYDRIEASLTLRRDFK